MEEMTEKELMQDEIELELLGYKAWLKSEAAKEGIEFLRKHRDEYDLEVRTDANGIISLALIRDNADDTFTKVFDLNMSDIYAQCSPSRIIERLMIQTIKADAPDIDDSAEDSPF